MEFAHERAAMRNDPMPNGLDGADRLCYMQFAYLYKLYRTGVWTKEQAKAEKQRCLREYAINKANAELYAETARMRGACSTALSKFAKEQTVQNAQLVFEIWDGMRLR